MITPGERKVLIYGSAGAGILFAVWAFNRKIGNVIQDFKDGNIEGDDPFANWARRIHNALYADGWWNEDEEAIYKVAEEMGYENIDKVKQYYSALYKIDMLKDLEKWLSNRELQIFYDKLAN